MSERRCPTCTSPDPAWDYWFSDRLLHGRNEKLNPVCPDAFHSPLSPPSTNKERCGAISLDGVTCQLVEGHQGVHKNDARHWRNAAHPATNGDREEGS